MDLGELAVGIGKLQPEWTRSLGPTASDFGKRVFEPVHHVDAQELLKEIAPQVTRVATLFNPAMASFLEFWLKPFKAAAPSFGVEGIEAPVHDTSELETVMAAQAREANSGLFVILDAFTITYRSEVTSLAARYRLPAVY